jgi:hypothetical protein
MLLVPSDVMKMTPFIILKRKKLPKGKLPSGIIFKCNEQGRMTDENMVQQPTEAWDGTPATLLKKTKILVVEPLK